MALLDEIAGYVSHVRVQCGVAPQTNKVDHVLGTLIGEPGGPNVWGHSATAITTTVAMIAIGFHFDVFFSAIAHRFQSLSDQS